MNYEPIMVLLQTHIEEGGKQEEIQALTLKLIGDEEFDTLPNELQDVIYSLNMDDLNHLERDDYVSALETLRAVSKD